MTVSIKKRQPSHFSCLVLGLTLVPVPLVRTGFAEFLLVGLIIPAPDKDIFALGLLIFFSVVSLPPALLFVAWALTGAGRPGLPNRSLGLLLLLVAYYPIRLYYYGIFFNAETRAEIARMHAEFPVVWLFKHLDAVLLLALVIWAVRRKEVTQPMEKLWFHWLLFLCALWAVCALFDSPFGLFVSRLN